MRPRGNRGAGSAKKGDAERLHEAGGGKRCRQREQRSDARYKKLETPGRQLRAQQDGLEGQPLGDKAVERRQRRYGGGPHEKQEGRLRHAVDEAAEVLKVGCSGGGGR